MIYRVLIFVYLILSYGNLHAEEKSMKIEWKDVKGSRGYIVRLKQSDNSIIQKDVNTNAIDLKLNAGDYEIQVAGKNAFGKPGKFSKWKSFTVRKEQKSATLNLSSNQPIQYSMEDPSNNYSILQKMIPGYIQYNHDLILEPIIYWALIPTLFYVGIDEKLRGDAIARDPWNDPVILYFTLNDRTAFEKYYFQQRRNVEKKKYNQSQDLQKYMAGGLILLYFSHLLDVFLFDGKGIIQIFSNMNEDKQQAEYYRMETIYVVQFNFNVEL